MFEFIARLFRKNAALTGIVESADHFCLPAALHSCPPDLIAGAKRIIEIDAMPHIPEPQWYGMAGVTRQLLDLPPDYPLNISMHHGIHFNETDVLEFYRNGTSPIFVNRAVFKSLYEKNFGRACYIFGSAHVWYRRLNNVTITPDARGTLAFPAHSSHYVHSVFDFNEYADILVALPDKFQPVTVCMYWKDFLLGRYEPFSKRGMRIVTAGHLFDPSFIENFYGIIRHHRFCTGNEIGTHAVLALEMGIPYFKTGTIPSYKIESEGDPSESSTSRPRSETDWFERLIPNATTVGITPELAAAAQYAHGCDEGVDKTLLRRVIVNCAQKF